MNGGNNLPKARYQVNDVILCLNAIFENSRAVVEFRFENYKPFGLVTVVFSIRPGKFS